MAAKLKKGDKVFILAGKDKGKEGEIVQILGSDKAIVQGINLVKKHKKPSQEAILQLHRRPSHQHIVLCRIEPHRHLWNQAHHQRLTTKGIDSSSA